MGMDMSSMIHAFLSLLSLTRPLKTITWTTTHTCIHWVVAIWRIPFALLILAVRKPIRCDACFCHHPILDRQFRYDWAVMHKWSASDRKEGVM
ncbi:hypothetical protein BDV34DRAFT_205136 [Aspergillus parasiticus]|uniref:Uncharacterized protein n=1 Tax=Aspergillus parasiticus TaxID=5067 RepID=A0A5N6D4T3_ASPPA|nr:hypothetical protein BDV34DRAFT_205136 [Aspergillus parasiticus]